MPVSRGSRSSPKTSLLSEPLCWGASALGAIIQALFNLQFLRNANRLSRFLQVWLVLFFGSAVVSPLVKPEAVHLVCTVVGGLKLVQVDAAGADVDSVASHTALDCPTCLPMIAPPVADVLAPLPAGHLSHVLQTLSASRLASLLAQPWQARAPPLFSA